MGATVDDPRMQKSNNALNFLQIIVERIDGGRRESSPTLLSISSRMSRVSTIPSKVGVEALSKELEVMVKLRKEEAKLVKTIDEIIKMVKSCGFQKNFNQTAKNGFKDL